MNRQQIQPNIYRSETVIRDIDNNFRTIDEIMLKNRKKLLFLEYQVMKTIITDEIKPKMDKFIEHGTSSVINTLEEFDNFVKRYDILISRFIIG